MTRRWSIDAHDLPPRPPANCKRVIDDKEGGHIQPVYPFADNLSSTPVLLRTLRTSQQVETFSSRRVIYRDMAEWHYPLKDGSLQIFPANQCKRRWSLDQQSQYDAIQPYKANHEQYVSWEIASIDEDYDRNHARSQRLSCSNASLIEGHDGQRHLGRGHRYKLKDGRTIVFPDLPWDYDVEGSPIPKKRLNFDDKDEERNFVGVPRTESIFSEDYFSPNNEAPTASSHSFTKRSRKVKRKLICILALMFCRPIPLPVL